jgi:hypothetical protein
MARGVAAGVLGVVNSKEMEDINSNSDHTIWE